MIRLANLFFLSIIAFSTITGFATTELPNTTSTNVSLEFQDIEIRKALQILAKFMNLNVLIEEGVQGKMSLHLSEVSPEEAMQTILHMHGLTQHRVGKSWIIESKNKSTATNTPNTFAFQSKRITLQHREAKEIAALFTGNNPTTSQNRSSTLSIDTRSNSLWIKDSPERIQMLEKLIEAFDLPIQQILIEARIVSIDRNFEKSLGLKWGFKQNQPSPNNQQVEVSINEETTSNNRRRGNATHQEVTTSSSSVADVISLLNVDLPKITSSLPLLWLGNNKLLDLELSAMENEGNARIISRPHLITADRTPASIETGSEIPYEERGRYGNTTIAYKRTVLGLKVTPELTPAGKILLRLHINHDKPQTKTSSGSTPIDTQELKTQVLLKPGETVILGGIYENIRQNSEEQVPWLGKIPIINLFFKHATQLDKTRELFIFVTPQLVSSELLAQHQKQANL